MLYTVVPALVAFSSTPTLVSNTAGTLEVTASVVIDPIIRINPNEWFYWQGVWC